MPEVGELYSRWEPDSEFDAIVIGSGIRGLGAAALLARHAQKRVLVLERHTVAGGFTHTFRRKGYEWDVGVHYIGEVHRTGSPLRALFDDITDCRLQWEEMGDVYDTVVIGGQRFEYLAGREPWRQRMHETFPDDADAIDRYLDLVDDAARSAWTFFASKVVPPGLAAVLGPWMRRKFLRHSDRTLGGVLDDLTDNRLLKAVLSAQFGDHGLPPGRASFAIHAMVFRHYLSGAAYPVGGASRIASSITPTIEAAGGSIVVGAEVTRIVLERDRAVGVELADGRDLRAPLVISDAGIANTALKLLPKGNRGRERLSAPLTRVERSASHICLYVGLRATADELGLGRSNLWVYPDADQDAAVERYLADPEAPLPLAYISFPSAKDPDFERRFPGRATIEVVSLAPYEWFAPWAEKRWQKRGDDYQALKDRLSERLLDALLHEVPQVADVIDYHELSTPVSTRHFAAYDHGEIYGLEHSPQRFREKALTPRTPIKGLFLTGQDVCTAGIAGALMGAALAASAILGRNLINEIRADTRAE
jgi:all-trans-retinol 13,14-reductase